MNIKSIFSIGLIKKYFAKIVLHLKKIKHFWLSTICNLSTDMRWAHIEDKFLAYIKGFRRYTRHYHHNALISSHVRQCQFEIFPYSLSDKSAFEIVGNDNINRYFIQDVGNLFGHRGLLSFFQNIVTGLAMYGKAYYCIKWDIVAVNGENYILPVSIDNLAVSTMKKAIFGGYKQRYSFLTRLFGGYYGRGTKNRNFLQDEIFFIKYPFGSYPLKKAYKYRNYSPNYFKSSTTALEAGNFPLNHTWDYEKTRKYNYFNIIKREYEIIDRRLSTMLFSYSREFKITNYYDIYSVSNIAKHRNDYRDYVISEFNNQIIQLIKKKNNLEHLEFIIKDGIIKDNNYYDEVLRQYSNKEIDHPKAVKMLTDEMI